MSLLRIPLLLAMGSGIHMSLTSPQPPPAKDLRVGRNFTVYLPTPLKICFWAAIVCEIALILALRANLPTPTAHLIQRILLHEHTLDPQRVLLMTPLFVLGVALSIFGTLIRLACYNTLNRLFTFELAILKDHQLVTTGPYSIVRHPSYTGVFVGGTGVALAFTSGSWLVHFSGLVHSVWAAKILLWSTMIVTYTFVISPRLSREDQMLRDRFGDHWEQWARRVPYWLIPGII